MVAIVSAEESAEASGFESTSCCFLSSAPNSSSLSAWSPSRRLEEGGFGGVLSCACSASSSDRKLRGLSLGVLRVSFRGVKAYAAGLEHVVPATKSRSLDLSSSETLAPGAAGRKFAPSAIPWSWSCSNNDCARSVGVRWPKRSKSQLEGNVKISGLVTRNLSRLEG